LSNKFNDYNFNNSINNVLNNLNFNKPTKIQNEIIPYLRKAINVVGISQTGSGKTHAFLLPLIENINLDLNKPQAIIITPTRELAWQISQAIDMFVKEIPNLKYDLLVGGTNLDKEKDLSSQIVIGTPGRILDAINNRHILKLNELKYTILDEADMIFDNNFIKEIDKIMTYIKNGCFGVFSATITPVMHPFFKKYFEGIKVIEIKDQQSNIEHNLINIYQNDRYLTLKMVMDNINPYLCLIFASTKDMVNEIHQKLNNDGYKCALLHGDLTARERTKMIKRINNLDFNYVVASDIVARGIDIDGVSHIISYDLPKELVYYIHRAGRTGRADYTGISYLLYENSELNKIDWLIKNNITFNYYLFNEKKLLIKTNGLKRAKYQFKSTSSSDDVVKINNTKKKKVKPNYKKKHREVLEKALRKEHQAKIKERIKKQRKQRKNEHRSQ
jgi:ATP-dependent RNA helicase CshB